MVLSSFRLFALGNTSDSSCFCSAPIDDTNQTHKNFDFGKILLKDFGKKADSSTHK